MADRSPSNKRKRPIATWSSSDNPVIASLLAAHSHPQKQRLTLSPSFLRSRTLPPSPKQSALSVVPSSSLKSSGKTVLQACVDARDILPLSVPPLILIHQLYAQLGSAEVDREISRLCRVGAVRKFKVGAVGEFCIMLASDYIDQIRSISGEMDDQRAPDEPLEPLAKPAKKVRTEAGYDSASKPKKDIRENLFGRFIQYLQQRPEVVHVTKTELCSEMGANDDEISLLFSCGFLTLKNVDAFWISVRNAGIYWTNFIKGRTDVIQTLKRRRHNEMLERELEEKRLRSCILPSVVIIQELLGKGIVERLDTPVGSMLRLTTSTGISDLRW